MSLWTKCWVHLYFDNIWHLSYRVTGSGTTPAVFGDSGPSTLGAGQLFVAIGEDSMSATRRISTSRQIERRRIYARSALHQ
jgi:hypothetical protein